MNNNIKTDSMPRNQTLIVVEGKLEKNNILKVLFRCFPELPIRIENIHVYENDIYDLYHAIEEEYGELWFEENMEIDIPFLVSRKFDIVPPLVKRNFTNVILMFDYERHDNYYSDEKIMKMQKHFANVEDEGLLYINYPMIESFYHYKTFPDNEYLSRSIPVMCKPGSVYKNKVQEESCILEYINLFSRLVDMLKSKIGLSDQIIEEGASALLSAETNEELEKEIEKFTNQTHLSEKNKNNLKFSIRNLLSRQEYMEKGISYWEDIRTYIGRIVYDNIIKADSIQRGGEDTETTVKEKYYSIEWANVLEKQNELSADNVDGIIMVLCTCITFLGEYKFYWKLRIDS